MAHQRFTKRNRRSRNAKVGRRRRAVGLGTGAGAVVAFGLGPLAAAPAANADDFGILDSILDPIVASLSGADPVLGAGLDGWLASLDAALGAASSVDPASSLDAALGAASSVDPANATAATTDLTQLYDTYVYEPSHTFDQRWIDGTTFLGQLTVQYDNFVNSLDPGTLLIGNGADGTAADPTGGAGGLFFGDGGTGFDSGTAGVAGGNGGIAYDGDGGAGGVGYEGSMGGTGGDTAYGIGGEGGQGGAADGGPAGTGGAGGNATGSFFGIGGGRRAGRYR